MLCDAIPSSCIQMRNLILSAFPRNMRLPDPFTPNLKVQASRGGQGPWGETGEGPGMGDGGEAAGGGW